MIRNVQYLRAIAAIMVVVFHYGGNLSSASSPLALPEGVRELGASGVDIFFVISGFIISLNQEKKVYGFCEFIANRLARIVPLYWVVTFITIFSLYALSPGFRDEIFSFKQLISSFLFVSLAIGYNYPYVIPGWTLEFEMTFYFLFAMAIAVGERNYKNIALALTLLAAIVLSPLFGEFFLGMTAARIYQSIYVRRFAPILMSSGILLIVSSAIFSEGSYGLFEYSVEGGGRLLYWGFPSFLIVLAASSLPQVSFNAGEALGNASYSIYLLHGMVYQFIADFTRVTLGYMLPAEVAVVVSFATTIFASLVSYKYFEIPVGKACRRWMNGLFGRVLRLGRSLSALK